MLFCVALKRAGFFAGGAAIDTATIVGDDKKDFGIHDYRQLF